MRPDSAAQQISTNGSKEAREEEEKKEYPKNVPSFQQSIKDESEVGSSQTLDNSSKNPQRIRSRSWRSFYEPR